MSLATYIGCNVEIPINDESDDIVTFGSCFSDEEHRINVLKYQFTTSPVLANLFLHYTFDKWMTIKHPNNPFARYADDAVIHCKTEVEAIRVLESLNNRMNECKLELHPTKTRIVYCKDEDRKENHENISFDFLGYTFRPRRSKNRWGKHFINFTPAISNRSKKSIWQKVRDWKLQLKAEKDLTDLYV
jgi:RNA-directed DNA polymerase